MRRHSLRRLSLLAGRRVLVGASPLLRSPGALGAITTPRAEHSVPFRPVSGRDFYEVLGVDRQASAEEIKQAYRRAAVQHHPDRNPNDPAAENRFREATAAYSILSDSDKRARYDRFGPSAFGPTGGSDAVDFGSIAELLDGLFGDVFGAKRKRGRAGADVEVDLEVEFTEAARGTEKALEVTRPLRCEVCEGTGSAPGTKPQPCPACRGRGQIRYQRGFFPANRPCQNCAGTGNLIENPCTTCHAKGTVAKTETLNVRIPAGIENGAVRTVRGAGEQTVRGAGDLHVAVRIKPHSLFEREGADVLCTVPISFPQAVLGAEIEIPTLDGRVKMKIPSGTPSGKVFRLRGKGIAVFGGAGKGDQLVKAIIEVPEKFSRRQRDLLEQLETEMGDDAHPQQKSFLEKLKKLF